MLCENVIVPPALNWCTLLLRTSEYVVAPVTVTRPYVQELQAVPEPSPPVPPAVQFWQAVSVFSL